MLGLELGKRVSLPSAAPAQATQDQTWIAGEIWLILDDSFGDFGGRKHRSWAASSSISGEKKLPLQ